MNIKWDAEKYTADFSFVHQYGNDVIGLLEKKAGGTVLDLGCGNGALTKALADQGWNAVGLDASKELLSAARNQYPGLSFLEGDAAGFSLDHPADAVFSNAVFHWIAKERQPDMMACVFEALKDGGQFVFEMGGYGNNAKIHGALKEAFEARGHAYRMPFYFPTIGEYAALLENAGFLVVYGTLFERPTKLKGEDGLLDWLLMFVKTPFEGISEEEKEEILRAAVRRLRPVLYKDGTWYCDYVRLRMKAVKPALDLHKK